MSLAVSWLQPITGQRRGTFHQLLSCNGLPISAYKIGKNRTETNTGHTSRGAKLKIKLATFTAAVRKTFICGAQESSITFAQKSVV